MKQAFRLKSDVKNPSPDKRYKRQTDAAEMWPAGSLWLLTPAVQPCIEKNEYGSVAVLEMVGASGRLLNHREDNAAFKLVQAELEPVEIIERCESDIHSPKVMADSFVALQSTSETWFSSDSILRWLYFNGKLTSHDILEAVQGVADVSEEDYDACYR